MKAVLFIAFLLFVSSWAKNVLDDDLIERINKDDSISWTAGRSKRFEGISVEDAKAMMGTKQHGHHHHHKHENKHHKWEKDYPVAYDFTTAYPQCNEPVLDQGQCGSCWAFGTVEALSMRYCREYGTLIEMSPQELVSCDWEGNMGCNGGQPHLAYDYIELFGARTLQCLPYTAGGGSVESCPHKCQNETASDHRYHAEYLKSKMVNGEKEMKKEIYEHGPITVTMTVYQDFMTYTGGVYEHKTGEELGGHAVCAFGWGEENGVKYWKVRNSWGPAWGLQGSFWIKMGDCGIDFDATSGIMKK